MAHRVRIFEVGPRDGLQNESGVLSVATKIEFVKDLLEAGVKDFELGAFVKADKVPQMADTDKLYQAIQSRKLNLKGARAWALVPNERGLDRAQALGVEHIAVFTAASDSFNFHNIGMTVKQSLQQYRTVIDRAKQAGMKVRGYVSTAFECPYQGKISPTRTLDVVDALLEMGVFQVSIGDTIGAAVPKDVEAVIGPAVEDFGAEKLAVHFHDTRGTALANSLWALGFGITTIDASAGGLGGCPYAPGATGNLATEDLLYVLHKSGVKTGIDLGRLCEASLKLARKMRRPISSRFLLAYQAAQKLRKAK